MKRLRSSPDVQIRTEEKGKSRRSIANISTVIALQLSTLLSVGGMNVVAPVKQPTAYARNAYGPYSPSYVPDPDMDIEKIMECLPTPESVERFFKAHTEYERDSFPIEFASEYRKSPEGFQKDGWKGCCNNYAEFACEWGAAHGHSMYLVSLWPQGWHEKLHESYHQFAVLCVENNEEYIIFDNQKVIEWNSTIEDYVESAWKDFSIPPVGGQVKWVRTQPNMLSKMFYQIGFNEENMVETKKGNLEQQSVYVASNIP